MSAPTTREVDYPKDQVFSAAKRYILLRFAKPDDPPSKVIAIEDISAGLIRFTYRDERLTEPSATIEFIELEGDRTRMKVTFPSDYSGRGELFLGKLIADGLSELAPSNKDPLPYETNKVYQSALRFILKKYVGAKQKKEEVVRTALQDAGVIRFVYRRGSFTELDARVEVISQGKGLTMLKVAFPSGATPQQILFQDELLAAVKDDLGIAPTPEATAEPIE